MDTHIFTDSSAASILYAAYLLRMAETSSSTGKGSDTLLVPDGQRMIAADFHLVSLRNIWEKD